MSASDSEQKQLRRTEGVLTAYLVFLKLHVLYMAWGKMQGFDALPWIDMFRATRWFQPVAGPKALFGSYHPPLSYLACRWIYAVYPHEVEASQILSTFAMIGATFALRSTLRTIGILWTVPGLVMLYVTASLPLLVWLSIETSYDALVFMWFTAALALSAKLFWTPVPAAWWRKTGYVAGVVFLGLVIAAGLLTKFNAIFACLLPFLIIFARRGLISLPVEAGAPLVAVALGTMLVAPLYYTRYYVPLHHLFPSNMDWLKEDDLKAALAKRDADRWGFLLHILRLPAESVTGAREPVRDSFFHSTWLQLWKRDGGLAGQEEGPVALRVSNFYIRVFPIFIAVSTALFCFQRRRLPAVWLNFGLVLLAVSVTYGAALLYYGWSYPLWDWEPLKAKYMTPAVLWIAYCTALPFVGRSTATAMAPWLRELVTHGVPLLLMVFMFVNHLLPVY
ncbi:MAG: hypothetical protein ACLP1X_26955 [Polyangiaceae bacterium]